MVVIGKLWNPKMCTITNSRIKPLIMHVYINCLVFLALFIRPGAPKFYTKYALLRVVPVEDRQLHFIQNMSLYYDVNFWTAPGSLFQPIDFVVSPADKKSLLVEAQKLNMYMTTIVKDIEKLFDAQTVSTYTNGSIDTFNWNSYFRTSDIERWLQDMAEAYPQEMEIISMGKTYENRDIYVVKIVLSGSKRRSKVFFEGGCHAREWITISFITYMIHEILFAPNSNNVKLKTIAETYEFYFIPILNPDGYEYTLNTDRLWRKNRNNVTHPTDLNRNFPFEFGATGLSQDVQSEFYRGSRPFSERESRSLANYIRTKQGIEYYFSIHSYGQFMVIPHSSVNHTNNYDQLLKMCNQAAEVIATKFNTQYTSGNSIETMGYYVYGDSASWVNAKLGVPYVIQFQLRDNGFYGFALPNQLITPTCQETLDGVVSLLMPRTANFSTMLRMKKTSSSAQYVTPNTMTVFCTLLLIILFSS